jgi:hypothetical protein
MSGTAIFYCIGSLAISRVMRQLSTTCLQIFTQPVTVNIERHEEHHVEPPASHLGVTLSSMIVDVGLTKYFSDGSGSNKREDSV